MTQTGQRFPLRKRILFSLVPALLLLALALAAELTLRLLPMRFSDDPYLNLTSSTSILSEVEVDGTRYFQVTHPEAYRGRNVRFAVEKPANTIRIFCLGGSASAGWPHPPSEIYSEYLSRALQAAFIERNIEVLNVSAHAWASYRVRQIFEEIIRMDPDLMILYSGNNEFLERRTYFSAHRTAALTRHSRLLRLLGTYKRRWLQPENTLSGQKRDHDVHDVWTRVERIAQVLRQDPKQLAKTLEHYKYTMQRMVDQAAARNVPLLLVTVPVNLRDWHPNVSVNEQTGNTLDEWSALYDLGRRHLIEGRHEQAVDAFDRAIEIERVHAASFFYRGRALERQGKYGDALQSYATAKDLDHNPFRALSAFNDTLRELAQRSGNAVLLDAEALFATASEHGAPGFDLFLDYVHPTKKGNLLLARAAFDTIVEKTMLGEPSGTRTFVQRDSPYNGSGAPYDERQDMRMQKTLIWLFAMMHQYEGIKQKATAALQITQDGGGYYPESGKPDRTEYEAYFKLELDVHSEYLEMERNALFGLDFDPDYEEKLQRHYREVSFQHIYKKKRAGG